jgi:hypothetical protein
LASSKPTGRSKLPQVPKAPFRVDVFIIELMGKFGITGTCVAALIYIFLTSASTIQKQEFIDKFILLKWLREDNNFIIYAVLLVVIIFVFQRSFYIRRIRLKDERIRDLEQHNNALENKLLNK